MASSFAQLRAKQENMLDKIQNQLKKNTGGSRDPTLDDETYWNHTHVRGADGTGEAIVRLLPPIEGEDVPFVQYEEYIFEGPGGWYVNKSRRSLGSNEKDPAYEYNGEVFKKYKEKEERKKHLLGRKQHTTVQIFVKSDPNAPENEGKVFKWKIGPQVWNLINAAMFPEFKSKVPLKPFDPFDGADLIFRVYSKKIAGKDGNLVEVPSYDKSEFAQPSALCSEEQFEKIFAQQYSLADIVSPDKFESYENLKNRFDEVMGNVKKNFLDSDEPLQKAEPKAKTEIKAPTRSEIALDDEIPPFDTDDAKPKASEFDADEDWFNNLKK